MKDIVKNIKFIPNYKLIKQLSAPITLKEVTKYIKSIKSKKSPGSDGIPPEFYKLYNDKISKKLQICYNKIINNKITIPKEFKKAITVTILKPGGDPQYISPRRPISLLNVDYKILTILLARRLDRILKEIINQNQRGFIRSRLIYDSLMDLNCSIELIRQNKSGGAFFLDL